MYPGGFGNYDYYGKGRYSTSLGKQTAGRETIIHTINVDDIEEISSDDEDSDDDELDDYVNDLNSSIGAKLKRKTVDSMPMSATDPYAYRGKDSAAGQLKNTGGSNVFEYAGHHKNFASKGMVPNFTYRSKNNTKGPGFGTQGSATYIRNRPGRKSGTQYGSSRPHKLLTNIENDRIFNLSDIDGPMVDAFTKQQNKIKKVLSIIKEYLLEENTLL
jgi:hypothetical protein